MRVKSTLLAVCLLASIGNVGLAQTAHDHTSMNHTSEGTSIIPKEPGQDTFAAIAEIMELLMNDPHTDWRQVSLGYPISANGRPRR